MDQRSIVLFLSMKGYNALRIHDELVDVLEDDAVSCSTVTKYLREAKYASEEEPKEKIEEKLCDHTKENAILPFLDDEHFASVRTIANALRIPKTTMYYTLTKVLGMKIKHLKWIPHTLNSAQLKNRITKSKALLEMLKAAFHGSYDFVITLDELWFYFINDYEKIWVNSSDEPPSREKKMISSKKYILSN